MLPKPNESGSSCVRCWLVGFGVRVGADRRRDDAACVDAGGKREAPHEHEQGDRRNPSSLSPPHEPPDRTRFGGVRLAPSGRRELGPRRRRAAGTRIGSRRAGTGFAACGIVTSNRRARRALVEHAVHRRLGDREDRERERPARERGRDVVADHRPLVRLCDPGEPERPGHSCAPASTSRRRRSRRRSRPSGRTCSRCTRRPGSSSTRARAGPCCRRSHGRRAIPGMKWSTPLVVGSIGIRTGDVHVNGSVAVLMTMSFERSPCGNGSPARRRRHGLRRRPRPTGSAEVRRFPATAWSVTRLIEIGPRPIGAAVGRAEHPDLVPGRVRARRRVPFGCATGWPPRPEGSPPGETGGPHVRPPSVDVLMKMRSPAPMSSHSV